MNCCLPPGRVLTRQERAAIARLRERRAAGLSPTVAAHSAASPRHDPLVTFYAAAARSAVPTPPRKPRPKRRPDIRKPARPTVHQLKKDTANLRRIRRTSPRIAAAPQSRSTKPSRPAPPTADKGARDAVAAFKDRLRTLGRFPPSSQESSSSSSEEERAKPFINATKAGAVWHKLKGDKAGSEESTNAKDIENSTAAFPAPHMLKETMRKKWDDVVTKFGGNSAKGERFVMKARPETSDFTESNNDIYFQNIMTMES